MIAQNLLQWYDNHGRDLPWRVKSSGRGNDGGHPSPYHVWLSEIMLQQTTVATVKPYFEKFIRLWPTVSDLAAAPLDAVLTAWAGLGYYARARNLHKCAQALVTEYNGQFPRSVEALQSLPGIGPYTAAAIAAIAFDVPVTPVDGNIERVTARLYAITTPLPAAKAQITERINALTPQVRAGDFAESLMDLGATVCTPRNAACDQCPLDNNCAAYAQGIVDDLPRKQKKKKIPTKVAALFWLENDKGEVYIRRRAESGMLGGMMEFPSSAWQEGRFEEKKALAAAPVAVKWQATGHEVKHTFSHFHLRLKIYKGRGSLDGIWLSPANVDTTALPTVMKKVVRAVNG